MKKLFYAIACCALFASCCTVSHPICATSNPVGTRYGETSSYVYLGFFGSNGNDCGIEQSAKKGNITKISHVDMRDKAYFFGIVKKRTITVYGE